MSAFKAEYQYKYPVYDVNGRKFRIYFHDAVPDKITMEDKKLIMAFSTGFTVQELTDGGTWLKPCETGASAVIFDDFGGADAVLSECRELDGEWVEIARNIDFSILAENVNSGRWKLEFLADYLDYYPLFKCSIEGSDEKQFSCELVVFSGGIKEPAKITFLWDVMKEW